MRMRRGWTRLVLIPHVYLVALWCVLGLWRDWGQELGSTIRNGEVECAGGALVECRPLGHYSVEVVSFMEDPLTLHARWTRTTVAC